MNNESKPPSSPTSVKLHNLQTPIQKLTVSNLAQDDGVIEIYKELKKIPFGLSDNPKIQAQNVAVLIQKYQSWATKLTNTLEFNQFIASLEKLGNSPSIKKIFENIEHGYPLLDGVVLDDKNDKNDKPNKSEEREKSFSTNITQEEIDELQNELTPNNEDRNFIVDDGGIVDYDNDYEEDFDL